MACGHPPRQTRYAVSAKDLSTALQGLNGSPLNNAPRETVPDDSSDSHSDIGRIRTRTMRPVPEWTMAFFPLRSFLS